MSNYEAARAIALNLLNLGDPLEESRIRPAVENAVRAIRDQGTGTDVDVESLVRDLETNLNTVVGFAATLTDPAGSHVPWLPDRKAAIEWLFSRRYERFLREQEGWATRTVLRTSELTDHLLGLLEDPRRPGLWDRRGMVVGQVQSGKTSNYISLICRAADAGYKFVVVLTGTTNSLRAQTQLRIDEGFVGWDTRLNLALDVNNRPVGVGTLVGEQGLRPIPSTNAEENGDFRLQIANQFNVRLGGDPVIMVVKKNGSVLRNLTRWARSLSPVGPDQPIPNVPMLLIDDEADFASINVRRVDDEDPTVINQRIRELLNTFESTAYVGYTATPFANIFILPDQDSAQFGEDLFPRDFLINLPVPSNHVGPTKVFGLREDQAANIELVEPLPLVRRIDDNARFIPNRHRKDWVVDRLPESLLSAMKAFILVCAVRQARGQTGQDNSMLVHVTRFVNIQAQIVELVVEELVDLQNRIRYGDGDSPTPILDELKAMWLADFEPTSDRLATMDPELSRGCTRISWDEILSHLVTSSQRIQIKTINGSAKDVLDYWDHPDGLSVIAIGGDKLSRGLTLEGLSVSYYLRTSRMYDTLLQMGRWFGYRPGYADLCRLYTTEDLAEFYRHITMATEELKQDFEIMADRGMSPRQFGLRVRTHSAGLVITAANKMRHGTKMQLSYSGDRSEPISFDRNPEIIRKNHGLVDRLLNSLSGAVDSRDGNWIWRDVVGGDVADLLGALDVHKSSRRARGDLLSKYIRSQMEQGGLVNWTVALISLTGDRNIRLGGQLVRPSHRVQDPNDAADISDVYRIGILVSPVDEILDLDEPQRDSALEMTLKYYHEHKEGSRYRGEPTRPGGPFIRRARDPSNGLLLLYALDEANTAGVPFVSFAASFPKADNDTPVEYMVTPVYLEQEIEE